MTPDTAMRETKIAIELSAVVMSIINHNLVFLSTRIDEPTPIPKDIRPNATKLGALPSGPFLPQEHRTFDLGLRAFVKAQTHFDLGYVEQLYSFGDDGRQGVGLRDAERIVSVGYLALNNAPSRPGMKDAHWAQIYDCFPWEDWRSGEPFVLKDGLRERLRDWVQSSTPDINLIRHHRANTLFPTSIDDWNEEGVLERYEMLFEAGLVSEANPDQDLKTGHPMISDHRRILATGLARLRGKIKYRPVIFEIMPEDFTLSELQSVVEAITGFCVHKQNFRRALDRTGLVAATGMMRASTGGRPAELYRQMRQILDIGDTTANPMSGPMTGLNLPRA